MTDLDQAVLNLLTARWETASELVADLRSLTSANLFKHPWQPGDVLNSLDRLCIEGKAEMSPNGYRRMPERPAKVGQQRSMFG